MIDAVAKTAAAKTNTKTKRSSKKGEGAGSPTDRFEASKEAKTAKVSYLPQDPGMIPIQTAEVKVEDGKLKNDRFQVSIGPGYPQPKADAEGNFIVTEESDPRLDATNCFFIANQTLEMAERYAGSRIGWSFDETLKHPMLLKPHAGKDVTNAYYNSESGACSFFSYLDEKTNDRRRTGLNRDIVSHEIGHAILDGLRPHFMSTLSVGGGGFHESFADMSAMLSALNDDHVIEALRLQTKGDLSRPNLVSSLGEEMGAVVFDKGPLREAVNNQKWADQAFLPYFDEKDPGSGLGTECHSYANLFNGAFYEIFNQFYNQASADPQVDFKTAVATARDKVGTLLLRAVEMGPVGDISAREAAQAFLRADLVDNGGENAATLIKVFSERNLMNEEEATRVATSLDNLPKLRLNDKARNPETAAEWFSEQREKLGLPEGVEFEYDRVRVTDRGETFISFTTSRDKLLEGPSFGDYEGSLITSKGGVLLGFNKDGELFTYQYDDVSDRELEDITNFFEGGLKMGHVMKNTGEPQSFKKGQRPKLVVESVVENGRRVLRRSGVI